MVTFRFYAQLNDFLPRHLRQRRFPHAVAAPSSVKDAIEAIGVPHPEIDVILVNGKSEGFTCRLRDGDDVSVYPPFRSLALAEVQRLSGDPPRPTGFVVDTHLRKLASFLRLCGVDAIVLDDDAELAQAASRDGRVALTRDVGLLKRGIVRYGYWVRATEPERQLAEVVERFDLADTMEPFSRCLRCNTPVVRVDAAMVADSLPARTRATFRRFNQCPTCRRVYWEGTHYMRLKAIVERASRRERSGHQSSARAADSMPRKL